MSVFTSRDFLRLKLEWYEKLKQSGFEDIEDVESPKEALFKWDSCYLERRNCEVTFELKKQYFIWAGYFLNEYTFETEFHKKVWQLHAEGFSLREVSRELKSNLNQIYKVVKGLRQIMVRQYKYGG